MIAHAREDHPDEACGVIVGPEGSDVPTRLIRMTNAERSPTFFRFEPQEQFALYKADEYDGRGDRGRLPFPHCDRGLSIAHRHLPRQRTSGALPDRFDRGVRRLRRGRSAYAPSGLSTVRSPRKRSTSRNSTREPVVGRSSQSYRRNSMSVEVRIPTILRTFTGGREGGARRWGDPAGGARRHRCAQPWLERSDRRIRGASSIRQCLRQ